MEGATRRDLKLIVDNEDFAEGLSQADRPASKEEMHRWPICGLPVGSFLQVIAMDQQTCILEVYQSADRQGRFCFVQGSLYDAVCNSLEGEDAALEMVSWESVRLNIRQIVDAGGFAKKIDKSLMSILMESSRRRDEAADAHGGTEKEKTAAEDPGGGGEEFKKCLRILREDMGDALISASVADLSTGNVLASHHNRKTLETAQLFMKLTASLRKAFERDPEQKRLGGHYILNLREGQTLMVLLFDEHQLGLLFDNAKCSLGLVLNAIVPKVARAFQECGCSAASRDARSG
ncbi:MAG: DUF4388 domain-containing protein [Syntrophales bacterium]